MELLDLPDGCRKAVAAWYTVAILTMVLGLLVIFVLIVKTAWGLVIPRLFGGTLIMGLIPGELTFLEAVIVSVIVIVVLNEVVRRLFFKKKEG